MKWSVFFTYCAALGLCNAIMWFLFFILFQVASVLSNVWLSVWTEDTLLNNNTMANTTKYADRRDMYLGVYGGLGVAQGMSRLGLAQGNFNVSWVSVEHYGWQGNVYCLLNTLSLTTTPWLLRLSMQSTGTSVWKCIECWGGSRKAQVLTLSK